MDEGYRSADSIPGNQPLVWFIVFHYRRISLKTIPVCLRVEVDILV